MSYRSCTSLIWYWIDLFICIFVTGNPYLVARADEPPQHPPPQQHPHTCGQDVIRSGRSLKIVVTPCRPSSESLFLIVTVQQLFWLFCSCHLGGTHGYNEVGGGGGRARGWGRGLDAGVQKYRGRGWTRGGWGTHCMTIHYPGGASLPVTYSVHVPRSFLRTYLGVGLTSLGLWPSSWAVLLPWSLGGGGGGGGESVERGTPPNLGGPDPLPSHCLHGYLIFVIFLYFEQWVTTKLGG